MCFMLFVCGNFHLFFCQLVLYSYLVDVTVDRAEDVLLHQKILAEAKDPTKRPAFHVRFMKVPLMFHFFTEIMIHFCNEPMPRISLLLIILPLSNLEKKG